MLELMFMFSVYGFVMGWQVLRQIWDRLYNMTDFKPLNCPVCLSFWVGLVFALFFYQGFMVIVAAFAATGFTYLLKLIEEGIRSE